MTRFRERALPRLRLLYDSDDAERVLAALVERVDARESGIPPRLVERWNESDIVLISYADSLRKPGEAPLRTLGRFLNEELAGALSAVHLLPFYPSSSDGGFAVIDYDEVDEAHGTWDDVAALSEGFDVMMDLVLNHCSTSSRWFQAFLAGKGEGADYFHVLPRDADVSGVVRPRTHDLLQVYDTHDGEKAVWATFSRDQVDLNFENPAVLLAMIDVLLGYVDRGARIVRLDAIAFLWKRLGTSCIHLRETHEVVRLMRDLLDAVAPHVVLLTETNVPNEENLSYFGQGDEAHMVYQFSLPPLLLHALFSGDATALTGWAASLTPPPRGCTYFNFVASHDGIGLRPAEGLIDDAEIDKLVAGMGRNGGMVSYRATESGGRRSSRPYEINISLYDALKTTRHGRDRKQVARFLVSQTIMLGLRGVPAMYIHSLLATPNDYATFDRTKVPRDINRHRWDDGALRERLAKTRSPGSRVFRELRRRMAVRRWQPAFHPDAPMNVFDLGPGLFAFERVSVRGRQQLLALHNMRGDERTVDLQSPSLPKQPRLVNDLISGKTIDTRAGELTLGPYECVWLASAP